MPITALTDPEWEDALRALIRVKDAKLSEYQQRAQEENPWYRIDQKRRTFFFASMTAKSLDHITIEEPLQEGIRRFMQEHDDLFGHLTAGIGSGEVQLLEDVTKYIPNMPFILYCHKIDGKNVLYQSWASDEPMHAVMGASFSPKGQMQGKTAMLLEGLWSHFVHLEGELPKTAFPDPLELFYSTDLKVIEGKRSYHTAELREEFILYNPETGFEPAQKYVLFSGKEQKDPFEKDKKDYTGISITLYIARDRVIKHRHNAKMERKVEYLL